MDTENIITERIIKCAIEVHKQLGPGLLESVYEECLCREFDANGLKFERQKEIPIFYKGTQLSEKYRLDMVVEKAVIIELKCTDAILPVHQAQLLTYMKLTGIKLGLILNFNVHLMRQGIKRMIL